MAKIIRITSRKRYGFLAEDEDARVCKDIPDSACKRTAESICLHLLSLVLRVGRLIGVSSLSVALDTYSGWSTEFFSLGVYWCHSGNRWALLHKLLVAQRMREFPGA